MAENVVVIPPEFLRCAGPNCGVLKGSSDRWWLMWSSINHHGMPEMHLAAWDERLAVQEGTIHVCGEACAQKLQSQFMGNILQKTIRANSA